MYSALQLQSELGATGVAYTSLDRSVLITSGSWVDVGRTALSVYDSTLRLELEKRALRAAAGLDYWNSVKKQGVLGICVAWLQHFPKLIGDILPRQGSFKISRIHKTSFKNVLDSIAFAIKSTYASFAQPVEALADSNITKLQQTRKQSNETIGSILGCWRREGSLEETLRSSVNGLAGAMGIEASLKTPDDVLDCLQKILDKANETTAESLIPPVYVRWWPGMLVGAACGLVILGSWRTLVEAGVDILKTAHSGLYNWVYEPLYQIYLTIRHDPNSQIALMGKESLDADLDSLQNMVVQFARDSGIEIDEATIRNAVRVGDLGPVMRVYEGELRSPFKSLFSGKLARSLLIQVQKTKVDAEIAVSGINQLIQAQQLVFGIVAALPAFGIVWFLWNSLTSYSSNDARAAIKATAATKDQIMIGLGEIEELCDSTLSLGDVGEIYVQSVRLKVFAKKRFSPERYAQFARDLQRIEGEGNSQRVLEVLMRMYAKY